MSKNWGKTPITNADKRHTTQMKYLVETDDGTEERIDRRPLGKVERFVDPAGNVMSLQIFSDGDPKRADTENRLRVQYHKKGFVEFSKCPLKHGTRYSSDVARKDFAKMPKDLEGECRNDPKVMERKDGDLYAGCSCQHIEWLIKFRKAQAADAYAKRNAHVAAAEKAKREEAELKAAQLEMARDQLAERKSRKPKVKDAAE